MLCFSLLLLWGYIRARDRPNIRKEGSHRIFLLSPNSILGFRSVLTKLFKLSRITLKKLSHELIQSLNLELNLPILHLVVSSNRKSTRLNSSHVRISYAVFCLKKKKKQTI